MTSQAVLDHLVVFQCRIITITTEFQNSFPKVNITPCNERSVRWELLGTMGVFSTVEGYLKYRVCVWGGGGKGAILSSAGDVQYYWGYHDACGEYHHYRGKRSVAPHFSC